MPVHRHVTTRRGFVAVSLYGVRAAYGASPLPSFGRGKAAEPPHGDAHGGHEGAEAPAPEGHGGHVAGAGMSPERFRLDHDRFVRDHSLAGGSADPHAAIDDHGHGGDHSHADADAGCAGADEAVEPVGVYLLACKWGYAPQELRLRAGVPYRLRMMAEDIIHGASFQLGSGSRIIRLRPNVVTEQVITFRRPGDVLVYCTVYCGQAHDAMQGRIAVA